MSESITLNPCLAIKVLLQPCAIRVSPKKSAKKLASTLSYLRSSRNPEPLLDLPLLLRGRQRGGITIWDEIEETPIKSPDIQNFVVELGRLLAACGGFDILNHSFESLKNSRRLGIHPGAGRHSMKRPDHFLTFFIEHEIHEKLCSVWGPWFCPVDDRIQL